MSLAGVSWKLSCSILMSLHCHQTNCKRDFNTSLWLLSLTSIASINLVLQCFFKYLSLPLSLKWFLFCFSFWRHNFFKCWKGCLGHHFASFELIFCRFLSCRVDIITFMVNITVKIEYRALKDVSTCTLVCSCGRPSAGSFCERL